MYKVISHLNSPISMNYRDGGEIKTAAFNKGSNENIPDVAIEALRGDESGIFNHLEENGQFAVVQKKDPVEEKPEPEQPAPKKRGPKPKAEQ